MGNRKLTKQEMIDIVGNLCGTNSIPYLNIQMYKTATDYEVKLIFDAILTRELDYMQKDIEQKKQEIRQLEGQIRKYKHLLATEAYSAVDNVETCVYDPPEVFGITDN